MPLRLDRRKAWGRGGNGRGGNGGNGGELGGNGLGQHGRATQALGSIIASRCVSLMPSLRSERLIDSACAVYGLRPICLSLGLSLVNRRPCPPKEKKNIRIRHHLLAPVCHLGIGIGVGIGIGIDTSPGTVRPWQPANARSSPPQHGAFFSCLARVCRPMWPALCWRA